MVAKNNLCMQVMIWFLSQPKSLDRMKNRWRARKERRKAMRDAYYARERKEAAYQAYLEEIKEIKEEEAKTKGEDVNKLPEAEERADEKKEALARKEPSEEKEIKLPEAEAKEIICETTFESPTQSEIEQLLKNESKPLAE